MENVISGIINWSYFNTQISTLSYPTDLSVKLEFTLKRGVYFYAVNIPPSPEQDTTRQKDSCKISQISPDPEENERRSVHTLAVKEPAQASLHFECERLREREKRGASSIFVSPTRERKGWTLAQTRNKRWAICIPRESRNSFLFSPEGIEPATSGILRGRFIYFEPSNRRSHSWGKLANEINARLNSREFRAPIVTVIATGFGTEYNTAANFHITALVKKCGENLQTNDRIFAKQMDWMRACKIVSSR